MEFAIRTAANYKMIIIQGWYSCFSSPQKKFPQPSSLIIPNIAKLIQATRSIYPFFALSFDFLTQFLGKAVDIRNEWFLCFDFLD